MTTYISPDTSTLSNNIYNTTYVSSTTLIWTETNQTNKSVIIIICSVAVILIIVTIVIGITIKYPMYIVNSMIQS